MDRIHRLAASRVVIVLAAWTAAFPLAAWAAPSIDWEVTHRFRLFTSSAEEKNFGDDLVRLLLRASARTRDSATTPRARPGENPEMPDLVPKERYSYSTLPYGVPWSAQDNKYRRGATLLAQVGLIPIVAGLRNWPGAAQAKCDWKVNGVVKQKRAGCQSIALDVPDGAQLSVDVYAAGAGPEAAPTVSVDAQGTPRDVLIVSLGDSFASGEGNPLFNVRNLAVCDRENPPNGNCMQAPLWLDARCHRSLISGPALAAWKYSRIYKDRSVTFLSFACSGAKTDKGITDRYEGRESLEQISRWSAPVDLQYANTRTLPRQLDAMRDNLPCVSGSGDNCQRRKPDYVMISTGGNDVGFAHVVREVDLKPVVSVPDLIPAKRWKSLEGNYDHLIESLNGEAHLQGVTRLFNEYPNPLRFKTGADQPPVFCSKETEDRGRSMRIQVIRSPILRWTIGGIPPDAGAPVEKFIIAKLRSVGAAKFGADFVSGWESYTRTEGKGYCKAASSWFYSIEEASLKTGSVPIDPTQAPSGTMHPNLFGHLYAAKRLCKAMIARTAGASENPAEAGMCEEVLR